jgi:hypothetical protein
MQTEPKTFPFIGLGMQSSKADTLAGWTGFALDERLELGLARLQSRC